MVHLMSDVRMFAVPGSGASSSVVYGNPPDWLEMGVWGSALSPGDLFVDVGANVGIYSLWAAGHGAHVIAVEPEPSAIHQLRVNISMNPHLRIEVVEAALSDVQGEGQLAAQGATSHISSAGTVGAVAIRLTTLDEIIGGRSAAGVKVDVEGAERLVMAGAKRALAEHRIKLLQLEWNARSELHFGESRLPVLEALRQYGYECFRPSRSLKPVVLSEPTFGPDVFARPCR